MLVYSEMTPGKDRPALPAEATERLQISDAVCSCGLLLIVSPPTSGAHREENRQTVRTLLVCAAVIVLATMAARSSARADTAADILAAAWAAAEQHDYATAVKGSADAQLRLAVMYERGLGVTTNLSEAVHRTKRRPSRGVPLGSWPLAACMVRVGAFERI
jgi:hypothetical protein